MERKIGPALVALAAALFMLASCKHEGIAPLDLELLRLAQDTSGQVYYHHSDTLLPRSQGSGHPHPLLRTWYDPPAAAFLDSVGTVVEDTLFSDGAVVVKELYTAPGALALYAIMLKQADHPNADQDGWVWAEITPSGEVAIPSSDRGAACRGCHSQSGNIDFTLMNAYFP
ncbi:MAG: cytochrome P460 family protein [Flavobacteriales bacterium]